MRNWNRGELFLLYLKIKQKLLMRSSERFIFCSYPGNVTRGHSKAGVSREGRANCCAVSGSPGAFTSRPLGETHTNREQKCTQTRSSPGTAHSLFGLPKQTPAFARLHRQRQRPGHGWRTSRIGEFGVLEQLESARWRKTERGDTAQTENKLHSEWSQT